MHVRASAPSDVADELDVRGGRADDAREAARSYVDAAHLAGRAEVRIIHGRGTGALRKAVRDELARHPLVGRGDLDSADGATIVRIAGRSRLSGRQVEAPAARQRAALDLAGDVALEDVALLEVVVALEQDAALETRRDLAHVLLDAAQRADVAVPDERALAHHADTRRALELAGRDHAARDHAEPRGCGRAHAPRPRRGCPRPVRREQADEGLLDVLGQLVDDAVGADVDALAIGELPWPRRSAGR